MRNFWGAYPALRLLIPFISGIALHVLLPGFHEVAMVVLGASLATIFGLLLLKKIWLKAHIVFISGVAPVLAMMAAAYLLTESNTDIYRKDFFGKHIEANDVIVAMVEEPPVQKSKSLRVVLRVHQLVNAERKIVATGKISASFLKDSLSEKISYGDVLALKTKCSEIDAPKNPEQFNYREYMSFHNIRHQAFLKPGEWKIIERGKGNFLFVKIFALRASLMNELQKFITTPNELAVAGALMLGYRDYITPDVTRAYAASGALHVLCVSGLHVGMVFLILSRLLIFMNKTPTLRALQTCVIVVCIWLYACLTGLSPSVMRAATMFSMIAGGKLFKQQPNIFNIIGASALILMIVNPYIMTEVGFKLSYFAVLGIVYLQPLIYGWFAVRNKILNWFWEISAVSIAAQATTFPLGLLYFHQFPNLFLFSNLVVIPASYFLISFGIATFALQFYYPLEWLAGKGFYWLTWGLNRFIFAIDNFPFSIMQGISISGLEAIAIYVLLTLLTSLLTALRFKTMLLFLSILLAVAVWNSVETLMQSKQEKLTVYSVKNNKAIAVVRGNNVFRDFDEKLLSNESSMLFHVKHHWWKMNIRKEESIENTSDFRRFELGYAFIVKGKKVAVVNSFNQKLKPPSKPLLVDVLILSNSPKVGIEKLSEFAKAETIVADCSNKRFSVLRWKADAAKLTVPFHDTENDGAFLLE